MVLLVILPNRVVRILPHTLIIGRFLIVSLRICYLGFTHLYSIMSSDSQAAAAGRGSASAQPDEEYSYEYEYDDGALDQVEFEREPSEHKHPAGGDEGAGIVQSSTTAGGATGSNAPKTTPEWLLQKVGQRVRGVVRRWYNPPKQYGFATVTSDDGSSQEDVFLHPSNLPQGTRLLFPGQEVEFTLAHSESGTGVQGKNITGIGGSNLKMPHPSRTNEAFLERLKQHPKIQLGVIKTFDAQKGFGFIISEEAYGVVDGSQVPSDIFVHNQSIYSTGNLKMLQPGTFVEYELHPNESEPKDEKRHGRAARVTAPGGLPLGNPSHRSAQPTGATSDQTGGQHPGRIRSGSDFNQDRHHSSTSSSSAGPSGSHGTITIGQRLQDASKGATVDRTVRTGTVKWYDPRKRYGFINCPGLEKEVWVGAAALQRAGFPRLDEGQTVEFLVETLPDGNVRAIGVSGPGGSVYNPHAGHSRPSHSDQQHSRGASAAASGASLSAGTTTAAVQPYGVYGMNMGLGMGVPVPVMSVPMLGQQQALYPPPPPPGYAYVVTAEGMAMARIGPQGAIPIPTAPTSATVVTSPQPAPSKATAADVLETKGKRRLDDTSFGQAILAQQQYIIQHPVAAADGSFVYPPVAGPTRHKAVRMNQTHFVHAPPVAAAPAPAAATNSAQNSQIFDPLANAALTPVYYTAPIAQYGQMPQSRRQ